MFKKKVPEEPKEFVVKGKVLYCPICSHTVFGESKTQFNMALASFFNLDLPDKEINIRTCSNCGYVLLFGIEQV